MSIQKQIAQQLAQEKKPAQKRLTVTVSLDDDKLLAKQADELGISKSKYLNLLVSSGLHSA